MRDFIYSKENYDLYPNSCLWLKQMGLRETRWFLDAAWLLSTYDDLTFKEWIREE